ncbi:MAG: hypothetical protein PSV18_01820 [Methylobacter sp.]|nr:hypothetical protein [Candidatus Methylobacter titanis]
MTQQALIPRTIDAAGHYLSDPRSTAGELIGGVIGSTYGQVGAFVGGTLGRMIEGELADRGIPIKSFE